MATRGRVAVLSVRSASAISGGLKSSPATFASGWHESFPSLSKSVVL